jgi:hypothetical protein
VRKSSAEGVRIRRQISRERREAIQSLGPHVLAQARVIIDLVDATSIIVFRRSVLLRLRT